MIKSDRTKRRKTQEELKTIYNVYSSTNSNTNVEINLMAHHNTENDTLSTNESIETMSSCYPDNTLPLKLQSYNQHLNFNRKIINCSQTSSNKSMDNHMSTSLPLENTHSFKDELSFWAVQCNVPLTTVDKLLKLMKQHTNINTTNLPLDSRTLLNTPLSKTINIRNIDPGKYSHFGLTPGILRYALLNLSELQIAVGIDGLPLAKSSNAQLWPILAYIVDMPKIVFPVGIYHGNSKPSSSDDFLADFISEAKELI